jgi:APA family basic amino acid/polyamine antiporter
MDELAKPVTLRACLTASDLTFLGIGAIIGAGIFVLTGVAAATQAGPAIIVSFLIAGLACAFAALSYAELAAFIGGCGSAYGYARAGLGIITAWIIGWDLILEYAVSVSTIAVGWSGYAHNILMQIGVTLPNALLKGPLEGGLFNLPALFIVLFTGGLLAIGVKSTAHFNKIMVFIKLSAIALFIVIASQHVNPALWHPFMPFGWSGVMSGAAMIFFAYIGFDAVSTAAEEVINPARNMPIGIIASLMICTLLYIIVSALLTGIVPYAELNVSSPMSDALAQLSHRAAAGLIAVGAIAGLTTVLLVMFYGLTRVCLAMSRDGLLPPFFSTLHPLRQTPVRIILLGSVVMAFIAALVPMRDLAELVNIGTLFAFVIVCVSVIRLRLTRPDAPRPFRTPWSPLIPSLGVISCVYLMVSLPWVTWVRFAVWLGLGLVIYWSYGRQHLTK